MDVMAALGAMVVTEGSNAAGIVSCAVQQERPPESPTWTTRDLDDADRHFAHYHAQATTDTTSLPATLLVVTACMSTLKGIVLDDKDKKQEDEDEVPQEKRRER
jgi:hypothetical protein